MFPHGEADHPLIRHRWLDVDRAATRAAADRVIDQVGDRFFQPHRVNVSN
jgi:hypothetical protein